MLPYLLLFPSNLPVQEPAPQEFALQFWDEAKLQNASDIVGIIGMLVNAKGDNVGASSMILPLILMFTYQVHETFAFTRCLVEAALASNSPTSLKTQVCNYYMAVIEFY